MEYQQTVDMLQAKVRKLEQLVELKDRKLDGELALITAFISLPRALDLTRKLRANGIKP